MKIFIIQSPHNLLSKIKPKKLIIEINIKFDHLRPGYNNSRRRFIYIETLCQFINCDINVFRDFVKKETKITYESVYNIS